MAAERRGREGQDDCDAAAAEEMVCTLLLRGGVAADQSDVASELKSLLERDEHMWRGVYDDRRFDRHVRAYLRRLARMAKASKGFGNLRRYQ